jgi:DNA-binding response OmpR family regulator
VARIKAVLRRLVPAEPQALDGQSTQLRHQGLMMDLQKHRCEFDGVDIVLTVTEFSMLQALVASPGQVFTRNQLVDKACGENHVISDRTVDSHIRRIRKKLAVTGADMVETVHGLGYRIRDGE